MIHSATFVNISPTKKLFHNDPYLTNARGKVIRVEGPYIVLDRTIFYAESGGQLPDRGTLNGVPVIDVQKYGGTPVKVERQGMEPIYIQNDTYIVHKVENGDAFTEGMEVEQLIDWDYRYALMRYHSASHYLYHAIKQVLKEKANETIRTKGCLIAADSCRFDLGNHIPSDWIETIEDNANALIEASDRNAPLSRMRRCLLLDLQTNRNSLWRHAR